MDLFGISDGKRCEDICKYAPPENKWPCIDCDMRYHDRAESEVEKGNINENCEQNRI